MECKGGEDYYSLYHHPIRIYPEWNVKVKLSAISIADSSIRIYPEWNVKSIKYMK